VGNWEAPSRLLHTKSGRRTAGLRRILSRESSF
jgi:hypothetical protein